MDDNGKRMVEDGKPLLEFVAINRRDNKQWALPGVTIRMQYIKSQQKANIVDCQLLVTKCCLMLSL